MATPTAINATYEEKYLVIKLEDIRRYLRKTEQKELGRMVNKILVNRESQGKNPSPSYIICNTDEAYAKKILDLILLEEAKKRGEQHATNKNS